MRGLFFAVVFLLPLILLSQLSSAAIDIEKNYVQQTIIAEGDEPAIIDFTVTNPGMGDTFEIYSLAGLEFEPNTFTLSTDETKTIQIKATPRRDIRDRYTGYINFDYEIYSARTGITRDKLLIKIVPLQDTVAFLPNPLAPTDSDLLIRVISIENITLEDLSIEISSPFGESTKTFTLAPYQERSISFPIDKTKSSSLSAGDYQSDFTLKFQDLESTKKVYISYTEKSNLAYFESTEGSIIRTTVIERRNEGNVPLTAQASQRLNIITRLVTISSPSPTNIDKSGFFVTYSWDRMLQPGEVLRVNITTNYTFPLIIVLLIALAVTGVYLYMRREVSVSKHVSHIRTKGGEFALKVTLRVKAQKGVEQMNLSDHLPHSMKLYENYGVKPHTIDANTRRLSWNIGRLNAGEERVFSYIMYSKIRVVGNFTLPLAHASYTKNGKHHHVNSNKTSFVANTITRDN